MEPSELIEYNFEIAFPDAATLRVLQDTTGSARCGVGSTIWDAGLVLAKYLEHQTALGKLDLAGKTVLELGSGTGIVGLALAKIQPKAAVTLSDKQELLPLLQRNIELNDMQASVGALCIDWCAANSDLSIEPDVILVSDGIWAKELHKPLADTLAKLASKNTRVLLAYETRKFDEEAQFIALWSQHFRFHDIKPQDQDPAMQSEDIYIFEGSLKS
ncbi:Protein-lysine N-methyltransferase efm6 [Dipsacomyces acuminosporus]|nr:Protein-lysine N-methyltransferase efm6 [Dipsacomyces acuminosporus]